MQLNTYNQSQPFSVRISENVSEIVLTEAMSQLQLILSPYIPAPSVIVPDLVPVVETPPAHVPVNVTDAVGAEQAVQAVAPRLACFPLAQAVQAAEPLVFLKVP